MFQEITKEGRREAENTLVSGIVQDYRKEKIEGHDNLYKYDVTIHEVRFITAMTDEELRESARLTIDMLEELKKLNNNGLTKEKFDEMYAKLKEDDGEFSDFMPPLTMWNKMASKEMTELLGEMDKLRRVGGAYAMLLANPCVKGAVVGVYGLIADKFDDDELYMVCAYFLLRAVMKMHSNEHEDTYKNKE